MRKRIISSFVAVLAVSLGIFAGAALGQGRYANVYSKAQVDDFVQQLEQSSNQFRTDFRNEVNSSDLSSSTKRTYNNYAAQFENSVDRLRQRFNSSSSWWESRNEVRSMISSSQNINTTMNSASFRRRIERQWNRLRNDINKLADTYDLPGLNGGGWTGGPGYPGGPGIPPVGGDGNQISPPSWARGTFYGTAPNGTRIILMIDNNGQVSANVGGPMAYGSFTRGNYLNMGDSISRVTREGDGFATTRVDNGERIVYSRRGYGSGGGIDGGVGGGGSQISPPSWARGTFYGTAPNGTNIVLTIYANGNVSANIGGAMFNGRFTSGNYLDMGDSISQVTQQRNGILTTRTDNGERIYYTIRR
jgi:hypothetical protein